MILIIQNIENNILEKRTSVKTSISTMVDL